MVDNLQAAFDRLTEKYIHRLSSSDEEIAVEYQLPTPSRKHKLKSGESPSRHKRKKRKLNSDSGDPKSSSSDVIPEDNSENQDQESEEKKSKESHKIKHDKGKKKRKGHHRHGKHSKNHKKNSHKSNHESKKRGRKHKDKEGKKSKQKKKKNKHHEVEPPQILERSASQESLESSNRSRSASPLPSIHTPSPSPTELDKPENNTQTDTDFLKDKFDKIKERRRNATKDAWDSLFDSKQKIDNQKKNLANSGKEKNQKLRETIEKLKAKNEKYKDTSVFNDIYAAGVSETDETSKNNKDTKKNEEKCSDDNEKIVKPKSVTKKGKKTSAKNESASVALEQAVKDISKWLDEAPKGSALSSPCDSPAQTVSTEEQDSRLDDEFSQGEKFMFTRKDLSRKRPSSREPKVVKRREIQRTIDRLQPGKSKGNLLTNMTNKNAEKLEEAAPLGNASKARDNKIEESSPKLSLGSVLPTVEFPLGNDHNFNKDDAKNEELTVKTKAVEDFNQDAQVEQAVETTAEVIIVPPTKKDAEVETDPQITTKPSQEKATPNLSAWFKAFGAPKATTSTTTVVVKKKVEGTEHEEKPDENVNADTLSKITSPKASKFDSQTDPNSPLLEGGESPHLGATTTPRHRRTSTGSSVSERSSFSQDLDSPRHQMTLTSPLLRSPASPRTEDFQKITYPIINGSVRAGFYQDTTSVKSSPEKSCSPREAPQSPYSPYSQHVYASNNATGSATPNYFVDHNKSPLPTYGQNAPPYYDTSKAPVVNKPGRVHDDYTALGPDTFSQNHYNGPYSPVPSPYPPTQTTYSQPQVSPQPIAPTQQPTTSTSAPTDAKSTLFPVKKRTYNEPEQDTPAKIIPDQNDVPIAPAKPEYSKPSQPSHSVQMSSTSVDDIALALGEKSELAKLNNLREKGTVDYAGQARSRENVFETNEQIALDNKQEVTNIDLTKTSPSNKKENVDMINMGYLNAENRRSSGENTETEFPGPSKITTNPQQKGFEIEAIAINLGLNNQNFTKTSNKPPVCQTNMTPAHMHERPSNEITVNQNIAHAHHNQYDPLPPSPISNFCLNDIELANKKLYSCNTTSTATALDYGNWKMTNQLRKPEVVASDFSTMNTTNNDDKLKTAHDASVTSTALNYNKNIIQHPQYSNYNNTTRTNIARTQELQQNLPAELRIPNPRAILKSDANTVSSNSDTITKNIDSVAKSSKADKLVQNHPLVSSLPYKTPYSSHSTLPLETLRNLPNISPMLERYTNDERYLSSFASSASSLYHDKTFQMAQMFKQSIASDVLPSSTSVGIYSQPSMSTSKDSSYKTTHATTTQPETKKTKRKKTSETKQVPAVSSQSYHSTSCNNDVLSSVKSGLMSASPFNFGTSTNMALGGMYTDNGAFSIEDFRNSTNQLMAANYMAAAVAHQQRSNEANAEKLAKPAHQNSNHTATTFPFLGSQVRAGYPFVGTEPSSPLYQQYIQRYQEELQRQTGAQIMGLYPPTYPSSLGVRQPYDSINRPSWL